MTSDTNPPRLRPLLITSWSGSSGPPDEAGASTGGLDDPCHDEEATAPCVNVSAGGHEFNSVSAGTVIPAGPRRHAKGHNRAGYRH
jgi:hypothetical protein